MSIEGTIQSTLGALVTGRCYPLVAPAKVVKPYITFQVIDNIPTVALDGPTGTENRRVQVDGFDVSYGGAKTLEQLIKAAMIAAVFTNVPLSSSDLHEPETLLYRVSMDYSIWT